MYKIINNRKFRLLLACISLLILVDLVQDTYAKYVSSANATSNFTIARWAFEVNSQDIIANNTFSNTIVPTFDANANIESNVIAPTSTGHFEVEIDYSDVEVAFTDTITLSTPLSNTVSDLIITGYKKNNDPVVQFQNNVTSITTSHQLNEANTVDTYIFYFEWQDGTGETMDNADDTQASIDGVAAITVNIQFIQNAANQNNNNQNNNEPGNNEPGNNEPGNNEPENNEP